MPDRLTVAGPFDRTDFDVLRKAVLKALAGIQGSVCRPIFHKQDFSQRQIMRRLLEKGADELLQVQRFVVGRNYNAVLH